MLSTLLAFLYLTVSTRAFQIHLPPFFILNKPATAAWTRSEQDQGDFVFVLRSLRSGECERLTDVPNDSSSGTISLNFTYPGCYEVGIGNFNTDSVAIRIGSPILVLEIDGNLDIPFPCNIEPHNSKPSACSPSPSPPLPSATSISATPKPTHHVSSSSAPASDSTLSSSTVAPGSSTPISTDPHNSSSSVLGYSTIPSSGISTSSPSDALSGASPSTSFSSSSASRTVGVSSSIAVISGISPPYSAQSLSTSINSLSTTGHVGVSSTVTPSQIVSNPSSATFSLLPSISISGSLNGSATPSDVFVSTTTKSAGLSSSSPQFLQVTSTIDVFTISTGIATSPTDDFTSDTLSSAPSSQVADSPSSTTILSTSSRGVTPFEPSLTGATGFTISVTIPSSTSTLPPTSITILSSTSTLPPTSITIPSSTSTLPPTSTSYASDSTEETRLPQVLGGVFAALSILLVILGCVLYRRHRRLNARSRDIEAHENSNERSGGLLTRPTMARTQTPQSFNSAYISSQRSSIDSIDEIVELLDPSGRATGTDYASMTTHESYESDALMRRESSDIASEHSYHSLTSNPFSDPSESSLLPELPRPDAVRSKSPVVQSPTRSGTRRSNGTTDSGNSRKTSRPESYFFMFVDGVMQPLDSRSDRYRSLVLSSESSFLMPNQVVLQERADALREEIVWLRRKASSLSSNKEEKEELLAAIRMREEDLDRLGREIDGEEK